MLLHWVVYFESVSVGQCFPSDLGASHLTFMNFDFFGNKGPTFLVQDFYEKEMKYLISPSDVL